MSKHTPGPWKHGEYKAEGISLPPFAQRIYMLGNSAAWVTGEDKESNARLIAAAPELLHACELALNAMCIGAKADEVMLMACELLRAAIAKATEGK